MATVLFTDQICEAARDMLKTGLSFTPTICQKGDLTFWPEGAIATLAAKIPAIFVKPVQVQGGTSFDEGRSDGISMEGGAVSTSTTLRVVVVDKFDPTADDVMQKRINRAEDVWDRFLDGGKLDMDGTTISGFRWFQARPVRAVFAPVEDDLVSFTQDRQLFAVAVDVTVEGEASR